MRLYPHFETLHFPLVWSPQYTYLLSVSCKKGSPISKIIVLGFKKAQCTKNQFILDKLWFPLIDPPSPNHKIQWFHILSLKTPTFKGFLGLFKEISANLAINSNLSLLLIIYLANKPPCKHYSYSGKPPGGQQDPSG